MKKKKCTSCYKTKDISQFYKSKQNRSGLEYRCIKCSKHLYMSRKGKNGILNRQFLYGKGDVLKNKQYIKDRNKIFRSNVNGWWWFKTYQLPPKGKNIWEL